MRLPKNAGLIVLAVWLVATGLGPFLRHPIPFSATVLPLLALAAGLLLLVGR